MTATTCLRGPRRHRWLPLVVDPVPLVALVAVADRVGPSLAASTTSGVGGAPIRPAALRAAARVAVADGAAPAGAPAPDLGRGPLVPAPSP